MRYYKRKKTNQTNKPRTKRTELSVKVKSKEFQVGRGKQRLLMVSFEKTGQGTEAFSMLHSVAATEHTREGVSTSHTIVARYVLDNESDYQYQNK